MKKNTSPNLIKSFILFCIAFLLLTITAPIGFLYTLLRELVYGKLKAVTFYFMEVAIALDNAGNVIMQHVLNDALLIKNKDTYFFGNKKETISSVIGKNSLTGTLGFLGRALNQFLNFLDKNHSFNSIIYDLRFWK